MKINGFFGVGLASAILLFQGTAWAHSGRTDSSGGHFNRRTGAYHFHGSGAARSKSSRTSPRTSYRTAPRTESRTTYRGIESTAGTSAYTEATAIRLEKEAAAADAERLRLEAAQRQAAVANAERKRLEAAEKKRLAADALLRAQEQQEEAEARAVRSKLRIANRLHDMGRKKLAEKWLVEVTEKFSDSPEADVAEQFLAGLWDPASSYRIWIDQTGAHHILAELIGFESPAVRLRKKDGNEITVPLEKLSESDQQYLRGQGVTLR